MVYSLAIADRSYSSWSLRGWLLFARFGLPVTLELGHLYTAEFPALIAGYPGARAVPALRIGGGAEPVIVWDSLAIAETLAERHPGIGFWPGDPALRGLARSMTAEMHSSFRALRVACPMNLRGAYAGFVVPDEVAADLRRIEALWAAARGHGHGHGRPGPWLFGDYSIADAFFAPVAARIAGYGLPVGAEAAAYVAAHLADPAFLAWRAAGLADPLIQTRYDVDLPAAPWPGPAAA